MHTHRHTSHFIRHINEYLSCTFCRDLIFPLEDKTICFAWSVVATIPKFNFHFICCQVEVLLFSAASSARFSCPPLALSVLILRYSFLHAHYPSASPTQPPLTLRCAALCVYISTTFNTHKTMEMECNVSKLPIILI